MISESTEPNPQTAGRLAAFRYRDFRLFWTSLFISNIGTWMQMTATNWLLYQLTDSPVQLGLNGVFRAAPAIVIGLFSGTFADRYDAAGCCFGPKRSWVCSLSVSGFSTKRETFRRGRFTSLPSSAPV
jgi:MFS family permease